MAVSTKVEGEVAEPKFQFNIAGKTIEVRGATNEEAFLTLIGYLIEKYNYGIYQPTAKDEPICVFGPTDENVKFYLNNPQFISPIIFFTTDKKGNKVALAYPFTTKDGKKIEIEQFAFTGGLVSKLPSKIPPEICND
jgi:hypothetical protein